MLLIILYTLNSNVDSNEVHFTWVLYLSTLYLSIIFLETYDFNFTTFERQIMYFSLHYISIKVLKVESRYYVAALKVNGWFFYFSKFDSLSVIIFLGLREVISQHFWTLTSCKCDISLQQFNNKKLILWYILDKILYRFCKIV